MAVVDINHNYNALGEFKAGGVTKKPPRHYRLSIESFSSLKSKEKFVLGEFKAGGYKWKLVLFPNGNKNRGVEDHISLYLEMGGHKAIKPGRIVTIDYRLFLHNRHKGKESYLVLQDSNKEKKYCIHKTIVGGLAGFDRFIPLKEFSDASNGYLIDDTCEFGAEVMVSETTRRSKVEYCLFENLNIATCKYVCKVTNFSELPGTFYSSKPLTSVAAYDQKYCSWRLLIFPKGNYRGEGSHVSLYLGLHNPHHLPPGSSILAEFTLRILDQIHGNHLSNKKEAKWYHSTRASVSWGFDTMITQEENARFSKDDSCIIEIEVTIQGLSIPRIGRNGVFKLFN